MVLSQEWLSGLCQLCQPRSQSAQFYLLEQLLLPLLCGQLLCLDAVGLIQHVYHSRQHLQLWYSIGNYYSCHHNLFLQILRVCHTISHYNNDILAAIAHLSVSVLYHQTLGLWPLFSMQVMSHHIQPHTSECGLHLCMYNSGWEGINHLTIFGGDYFIIFSRIQHFGSDLVIFHCGSGASNCQKVGHMGINPGCYQCIYFPLSYHSHDKTYCGVPGS